MTNAYQVYTAARQLLEGYAAAMQPLCRREGLAPNGVDILLFLANNPGPPARPGIAPDMGGPCSPRDWPTPPSAHTRPAARSTAPGAEEFSAISCRRFLPSNSNAFVCTDNRDYTI